MTDHHSPDPCLFCRIAAGAVPSFAVHCDDDLYAFLDIHPIRPGHVQIIPRVHYACFDELPPDLAARIVTLGQRLSACLKAIYGVRRVGFLFTGGDVPHAHAHVVPLVDKTDITSRRYIVEEDLTFRDTPRVPDAELARTAERIRSSLG
jgi:histidine triad (HIT) family protein